MALIGYTLVVASSGATLQLLRRCHTPFDSGAKAQSAHYFCDMKDSCTSHYYITAFSLVFTEVTTASLQWCDRCMDQEHRGGPRIRDRRHMNN
jgi:hypothetical protein